MTDLRQAAQQALDAWDSPLWKTGTTAAKIADLRAALEQQAEPVALWQKRHLLRTEGAWENTNEHDAKWWSEKAQGWEIRALYTTPPQQQAEPVAWMDREGDLYKMPEIKNWAPPHVLLYTTPPKRQWVGLTDEDVNRESSPIAQQMKLAFHAGMYVAQKILKEKNNG